MSVLRRSRLLHNNRLLSNPYARWTVNWHRWRNPSTTAPQILVGCEGCQHAFNFMNTLRTSLFFGLAEAPTFLHAKDTSDIVGFQSRPSDTVCHQDEHKVPVEVTTAPSSSLPTSHWGMEAFETLRQRQRQGYTMTQRMPDGESNVLYAVECFVENAQSIQEVRFTTPCAIVMGHENVGVSAPFLTEARQQQQQQRRGKGGEGACGAIVYIPTYGTVSSINVVTTLGIVLFYCYMDLVAPQSRTIRPSLLEHGDSKSLHHHQHLFDQEDRFPLATQYRRAFSVALPSSSSSAAAVAGEGSCGGSGGGSDGRVLPRRSSAPAPSQRMEGREEPRPIHPLFYHLSDTEITKRHAALKDELFTLASRQLRLESDDAQQPPSASPHRHPLSQHPSSSGISIFYENDCDTRSLGGMLRSMNNFLCDWLFWVGRRKMVSVGAVGGHHHDVFQKHYLGPLPPPTSSSTTKGTATTVPQSYSANQTFADQWAAEVQQRCAGAQWWLVSCGHEPLVRPTANRRVSSNEDGSGEEEDLLDEEGVWTTPLSSIEHVLSLPFYSLLDSEAQLRERMGTSGVVLVIPPEGKLPHPAILQNVTAVLTVTEVEPERELYKWAAAAAAATAASTADVPSSTSSSEGLVHPDSKKSRSIHAVPYRPDASHRGIPIQVGCGIALQRLLSVRHPTL